MFIDAGYLSKIAEAVCAKRKPDYDVNQFAHTLARNEKLWCKSVYYYDAPPFQDPRPNKIQKERKAGYDRFKNSLRNAKGFVIREGRLQKIGKKYTQKGVDTLLTMDLLEAPFQQRVKKIILIAADTDFVPILKKIKERGVYVILYYYTDRVRHSRFSMSNHIMTAASRCTQIRKEYFDRSRLTRKADRPKPHPRTQARRQKTVPSKHVKRPPSH